MATAFDELGLMPELTRAVDEMHWTLPTAIQAEAIPLILGGGDVLAAAETGSGKTGAFCLPILQICHEELRSLRNKKPSSVTGRENFVVRLNASDRDSLFAISPDGCMGQCRDPNWYGCRANVGVRKGKYYYEATIRDEGLCRVGWSTVAGKLALGTDRQGFGFGGTGRKSFSNQFEVYGEPFKKGDVIGCCIDLDDFTVSYTKNGQDLGVAFNIPKNLHGSAFYPHVYLQNAELKVNFGASNLGYPLSQFPDYLPLQKANPQHVAFSDSDAPSTPTSRSPLAIIIEPTIEMVNQVYEELSKLAAYVTDPNIRILSVNNTDNIKVTTKTLHEGIDIVVGTPGRLEGLVNSGQLDVSNIRFFALDEADRLLDPGMQPVVMKIHSALPKQRSGHRLQALLFSATLHSRNITDNLSKISEHPIWVDLKGKDYVPETVHHAVVLVDATKDDRRAREYFTDRVHIQNEVKTNGTDKNSISEATKLLKPLILMELVKQYNMDQCMIFCRTRLDCDNLKMYLDQIGGGVKFSGKMERGIANPYACVVLHSGLSPKMRQDNLQAFKDGDVRFLICTDVAARGIDIKELPFVINMTLPDPSEDYIHRIGRVGRAGCMGLSLSIVSVHPEKVWYHRCPNRGQNCENRSIDPSQGCCIWFDEPKLLQQVEERLGGVTISKVHDIKSVSSLFESVGQSVVYGQQRQSVETSKSAEHVEQLKPVVERLRDLEQSAQRSFLTLAQTFNKPAKKH
eukprot:TRINITY_DN364_c0_g2_i1.p1 TRINITY_DN364_c0_g2~~TRINITY_DN364_c0_g2_i1.p1  ORF type:complete len:740 (-),score=147.31 TRINITY_DN364_c0_g2_i1:388-2607(-)